MSSSSYCQGLQSCLEPGRLVEPRVVTLKLALSKSNILRSSSTSSRKAPFVSDSDCDNNSGNNADNVGGWSFLQCLATKTSQNVVRQTTEKENVYIPPNFKRSSSTLSLKSLEMCTESLGSETGSEVSESIRDQMALVSSQYGNHGTREKSKLRETRRLNLKRSVSFPPPLTSFSGSAAANIQLRPHRRDGRLVLEAVAVTPTHANFLSERIEGRLRLHLVKDSSPYNSEDEEGQEDEEGEAYGEKADEEDAILEREADEEDGIFDDDCDIEGEDLDEDGENGGGEMGMEKLARPSRCKEGESGSGNKGLLDWEPFCVAT